MTVAAMPCKTLPHALRDLSSITAHDLSKLGRIVTEADLEKTKRRLPLFLQMLDLLGLKLVPATDRKVNVDVLNAICVLLGNQFSSIDDFTNAILGDKE